MRRPLQVRDPLHDLPPLARATPGMSTVNSFYSARCGSKHKRRKINKEELQD